MVESKKMGWEDRTDITANLYHKLRDEIAWKVTAYIYGDARVMPMPTVKVKLSNILFESYCPVCDILKDKFKSVQEMKRSEFYKNLHIKSLKRTKMKAKGREHICDNCGFSASAKLFEQAKKRKLELERYEKSKFSSRE